MKLVQLTNDDPLQKPIPAFDIQVAAPREPLVLSSRGPFCTHESLVSLKGQFEVVDTHLSGKTKLPGPGQSTLQA